MGLLVAALSPALGRWTGAGTWAFRTAATLAIVQVMLAGLGGLFDSQVAPHFVLALCALAVAGAAVAPARRFDVFVISAAAFALDTLLVAGLARLLLERLGPGSLRAPAAARAGRGGAARRVGAPRAASRASGQRGGSCGMTSEPLRAVLRAGASRGWMPADATLPTADTRPWPIVLLTALGAWLAAIPLFGFFAMLLGPKLTQQGGAYVVGVLVLGAAAFVLRHRGLPVFVEQLAVPTLLTGLVSLAFGLFRDLPHSGCLGAAGGALRGAHRALAAHLAARAARRGCGRPVPAGGPA